MNQTGMNESQWSRRVERESMARQEAERLLEMKSLELFDANQRLLAMVDKQAVDIAIRDSLFQRLSNAFVSLGVDYRSNISILTAECGNLLDSACCSYSRFDDGVLHAVGLWNAPEDFLQTDAAGGHICTDVIMHGNGVVLLRDLQNSPYAISEPGVSSHNLQTCVAHPVRCFGKPVGALCALYVKDHEPTELEKQILVMLATAVGIEEDRWRGQLKTEEALKEAQLGNRAKTLFLATVSHEIRTPLTGILGYADLLLRGDHDDETMSGLSVIKSSGKQLLQLINDILDYSRVEQDKLDFSKDQVSIRDLVADVVSLHKLAAAQKGLSLKVSYECEHDELLLDQARVRQVLSNLIDNAVKFTAVGGVKLHCRVDSGMLHMKVKDSGSGIELQNIEHIFTPFFQEHSGNTSKYGGTGLGLSICRKLLRKMDGGINARLPEEGGAEFAFYLPVELVGAPDTSGGPVNKERTMQANRPQLLLVEDQKVNAELLMRMLKQCGCDAACAGNGAAALEMLRQMRFAGILMDVRMPVMDGLEATRRIRAGEAGDVNRDIPILAVTANAFPVEREACVQAGMNGFLGKPIFLDEMKKALRLAGILA